VKLTEGRVSVFSHEVVPDYLRTKPDPDVEAREQQLIQRSNLISIEAAHKQINSINKISTTILEHIRTAREEWESESGARASTAQTSSMTDTQLLISAVCLGKGLKTQAKLPSGVPTSQGPPTQAPPPQSQMGGVGKLPSAIKTTIKSAAPSSHPYARQQ